MSVSQSVVPPTYTEAAPPGRRLTDADGRGAPQSRLNRSDRPEAD